jgi:hypothetical protein
MSKVQFRNLQAEQGLLSEVTKDEAKGIFGGDKQIFDDGSSITTVPFDSGCTFGTMYMTRDTDGLLTITTRIEGLNCIDDNIA